MANPDMWHAQLSRRNFLELCLGASSSLDGKLQQVAAISRVAEPGVVHVYWENGAEANYLPPDLVLVPSQEYAEILTAVVASPLAPSPLTSVSRILTSDEALAHLDADPIDLDQRILPAVVAISMAEAVLHTDGRVGLRQLTPALCKRTLSFAWGRALAVGAPIESFATLPDRWTEAYRLISSHASLQSVHLTIGAMMGALSAVTQLGFGAANSDPAVQLAVALMNGDELQQQEVWAELSAFVETAVPLKEIAELDREERANLLQHALRVSQSSIRVTESKSAACAFIATRVAPGSLEHMELLRHTANPSVLAWYALYAVLQAPREILANQAGFGFRVLRDISKVEEATARPTADIAFGELKTLERVGVESISRKLGHAGEVEVELVPFVTSSFTYQAKAQRSRLEQQQLSFDADEATSADSQQQVPVVTKERVVELVSELAALIRELPEPGVGGVQPRRRRSR
ncbi:hypothetical protein [Ralstonia solanacearum]|uniref:hypothetical protein n=2 Tax=Ralstonia solanacearum TaxID=305 RepID=UPI0012FD53D8|nr:hypothetical protein [Ralstonia solanacearum]